jgi:regulation of enolase protein 1 (concanavalin A-like superfamily)
VWLRVQRVGGDYRVDASADGTDWKQIRLAHLHEDPGDAAVNCGLYACSPKGAGFVAEFGFLSIDSVHLPSFKV